FLLKAIAGFACIAGHKWPVFLKFKGGKGVATAAGIFLILTPLAFCLSLVTMLVIVAVTRYVSLGSIVSAAALPFFILLQGRNPLPYLLLAATVAGIIIIRHHSNIKRLLAGREHKLGERIKVNPCKS
ncbi:glycerol-3-phosphate acyltransferase, partial [Candidatus Aerophobetes bacterium]|nr:glycerol-3-phosphate acyltransferase [Candidatus Aerophobetes bacterium]